MYILKTCLTYNKQPLQPGDKSDLAGVSKSQIDELLKKGLLEKVKEEVKPKNKAETGGAK